MLNYSTFAVSSHIATRRTDGIGAVVLRLGGILRLLLLVVSVSKATGVRSRRYSLALLLQDQLARPIESSRTAVEEEQDFASDH